jgi:hypothetical protein
VSLVELGADEVASCENTDPSTSTGLEKVVEEEAAAKDDGHEHEHKQGDAHLVHEQQQGQGQGQPNQEDRSKGASASQKEHQQLSENFQRRSLAAAANDQDL